MHAIVQLYAATALAFVAGATQAPLCNARFSLINGSLCINSQFVLAFTDVTSEQQCAILCGDRPQCQAFSLSDGPCQLFEFNKCSKSVRDCSCSRRGRVFVRQQPGLERGQLCPAGYGDDLCGVKYKAYEAAEGSWATSRQKCESESGLVIMADVTSAKEMDQVDSVWSRYARGSSMWLGGFQAAGGSSTSDGWYWVGCNILVERSLWAAGEPQTMAVLVRVLLKMRLDGTCTFLSSQTCQRLTNTQPLSCASAFLPSAEQLDG